MAGNTQKFTLQLQADTSQAKNAISQLQKSLNQLQINNLSISEMDADLAKAAEAAKILQSSLQSAVDVNTGKLNLTAFNNSLKSSGQTLSQLSASLLEAGSTGTAAFTALARSVSQSEVPLKNINKTLANIGTTLKNTIKWELSSTAVHGLESALSGAVNYVKDLNGSLTDIRIVTSASADEMAHFAIQANKAAKELSTTTKAYADASLIYYQQGDNAELAAKKAAITIKAANSSFGTSAAEMSEYLTAVWNSYKVGADELERYVDIMAALGAKTATSLEEIATSMQKVAATSNTVGVSMEQVSSIISTVSSVTRESAESIGTSFKTIFARIGDLKLGETLEDGVNLGQVSAEISKIGVSILDANGEMRDMGLIIEELMEKWQNMSRAEQTALAQVIAGKRQYTQWMALMENSDMYKSNMDVAENATGELQKMQDIHAQSWEASAARVKAAWEGLYSSIVNDKALISLNNGLEKVIGGIKGVADSFGGLGGILTLLSSVALTVFDKQIVGALDNFSASITGSNDRVKNFTESYREQMEVLKGFQDDTRLTDSQKIELQYTTQIMEAKSKLQESSKNLSSSQIAGIEKVISALEQERDLYVSLAKYDEQHGEGKAKTNRKQMETQAFNLEGIKPVNFDYLPTASQQASLLAADFELINKYIETSTTQGREFSSIISGLDVPEEKMSFSGILDQIELITRASQQAKNALSAMGNLGLHSDAGQFNQASLASGKDLNTLTADFTNVLNNIQPTGLQAFDEQITKIKATLTKNPPKDTEGLLGYIKQFEQAINDIDFSEFEKHINKFKEFGVKEGWFTEEQFNGWIEGMKNAGLSSEEMAGKTKDAIDRAKMSIKELTQESQTMSQTLTQMASGLTGLVTLFNGIKNSTDKLFDGNTSGAEKFGAAITLITSLCYGYIAANKLLTAVLGKEKLELLQQKLVTDQLTWAHIKATAAETGHSVAMTVLKMVTNGVSVAFKGLKKALDAIKNHPIVLILTAIVAAAGLIVTVINKIKEAAAERAKEARQHAQDRIQELKEETKILAEEEKAADSAYEAYKQQEEARQKTGTASQDYYNSVDTLLEALGQEELKVLAVTGQYERLAQAIEEANTKRIQQNALAAVGNVASAKNMADMLFSNYDTEGLYADKIGKNGRFYYIDNIYDEIQSEFAGTGIDIGTILTEAGFSFNGADMHIDSTDPQALANVYNALSNLDNLDLLLDTSAGFKQVYEILEATGGLITDTQIQSASTIGANYLTSNFSETDLRSGGINYHTMEQSVKDYLISEGLLDPNTPEINTIIQDIISDYLTSLGENFTEQLQTYELANLGINDLQMSDTQLKAIIEAVGGEQAFYSQMAQTGSESYLLSSLTDDPAAFSEALTLLSDYGVKHERYQKRGPLIDSLKQIVAEDSDMLEGTNEQKNATIEELFMEYYENEEDAMAAYEQFLLQSDSAQKTTIIEMTNALVASNQTLYDEMVASAQKAYSTIDSLSQDFINNQMANNPLFSGMQVDFQNPETQSYNAATAQSNIDMAQALHDLLVDMASGSFEGFYRYDENSEDLFTLDPKYSEELVEAFIAYLVANGADETEVREQILYTPDSEYADSVFWSTGYAMPETGTMPFEHRVRTAASLALGLIGPEGIDAEQQMLGIWQGGQEGLATQAEINAAIALMDQERIMRARDAEIAAVAYSEETGIELSEAEPKLNPDGTEMVVPKGEQVILNGNVVVDNFDAFSSMLNFDSALTDSNLTALQTLGIDIAELEQKWSSIRESQDYATSADRQRAWSDYISTLAQGVFDNTARQGDADTAGKTIVSDTEYAEMRQALFEIKDSASADAYKAEIASIESTIQEYEELDKIIANLDIDTIAKLGSSSWDKLSAKIGKTKEEFLALSKIDQIKLLNKSQADNLQNMANEYDDLAAKAKEYAVQAQTLEEQEAYLQEAQEYEQLAAEARAEAQTVRADLIANIIEISDAAAERLTNAMETALKNAEKTKDIASILGETIDTGNLTAIQKATLEAAGYDLSNWTQLANDTQRAAEAARLWREYAVETTTSGEALSVAYQTASDLLNARTFTDDDKYSNLNNKDNCIQYMEQQYHATEETLGLISQAWDSLESKGVDFSKMNNAEITQALIEELDLLQSEIKNTSTEAAAEAKDQIVEIYAALAEENISAAQAAADAWINAFKQIADARAKLLAGENLMADIAGNPEQLLQYAQAAGMDPATLAKQIIGGTFTAEQLALPTSEEYISSEMAKYGFDQINSSGRAFGTTGRFNDAQALGVSASTEEGQKYLAQYYQAILQATGMVEEEAAEHALQIAQGERQYGEIVAAREQLTSAIEGAALAQEEYQKQTEALNAGEQAADTIIEDGISYGQAMREHRDIDSEYTGVSQDRLTQLNEAVTNLQEQKYSEDGSMDNLSAEDQDILNDFGINMDNVDVAAQNTATALAVLAQAAYDAAKAQYKEEDGFSVAENDDGTVTVTNSEGGEVSEASAQLTTLRQNAEAANFAAQDVPDQTTQLQASSIDMTVDEFQAYQATLQSVLPLQSQFDTSTEEGQAALAEYTLKLAQMDEGLQEIEDTSKETWDLLGDKTKKGTKDWTKNMEDMRKSVAKAFGKDTSEITQEFVEKHLDNLRAMSEGTEEEAIKAQDAIQDDLLKTFMEAENIDMEKTVVINADTGEVSTAFDYLSTALDQWDGEEFGFTIHADTAGAEADVIAGLNSILAAGAMTADQISAALGSISWAPEITWDAVSAEEYAAQNMSGGYELVDGTYVPISGSVEGTATETVYIPRINSMSKVSSPAGGAKKSGGGGGGGGGGNKQKHDRLDARGDRYHEVKENLARISENLEEIEKQKNRTYGKSHLENLKEENDLLQKQRKEQERYLKEILGDKDTKGYLQIDLEAISGDNDLLDKFWEKFGVKEGERLEFEFDAEGNISNWEEIMEKVREAYNAKADVAMTDEQWEKYEEIYQDLIDGVANYEETLALANEQGLELQDILDAIQENNLAQITYRVEYQTEINENDLELLEYYAEIFEDDLSSFGELMTNLTQQADEATSNLSIVQQGINDLNTAYANEEISLAQYQEALADFNGQLLENLSELHDLEEQIQELYADALEKAQDELDEHLSKLDYIASVMEKYVDIQALLGKGIDRKYLDSLYKVQISAQKQSVASQKALYDELLQRKQAFEAKMQEQGSLSETEQQQYEDLMKTFMEVHENMLDALSATLEAMRTQYENTIESIFEDFEENMLGAGWSLQGLADSYSYYQEVQDRQLSAAQEIYQMSKLNRQIEQSIEDATTKANKQLLKDLQSQINARAELNDLTEYDIEMMDLQYQMALKKMALEEAQAAKSVVRLTRDNDGNYAYQYTADEDQVNQAYQEYEDVLAQINDLASSRVGELEQQMLDAQQTYLEKLKELALDETMSEEEKMRKKQELYEQYQETLMWIQEQYEIATGDLQNNLASSSAWYNTTITESTSTAKEKLADMIKDAKDWVDAYWNLINGEDNSISSAFTDYAAAIAEVNDIIQTLLTEEGAQAFLDMADNAGEMAHEVVQQLNDELDEIEAVTKAWDAQKSAIESVKNEYEALAGQINSVITALSKLTEEERKALTPEAFAAYWAAADQDRQETEEEQRATAERNHRADNDDPRTEEEKRADAELEANAGMPTEDEKDAETNKEERDTTYKENVQKNSGTPATIVTEISAILETKLQALLGELATYSGADMVVKDSTIDTSYITQEVEINAEFPNVEHMQDIKDALDMLINEASQRAGKNRP